MDTNKPRLLVTGASGLLGLNFSLLFREKYQIIGVCNKNVLHGLPFDMVQRDFFVDDVGDLLDEIKPQVILHCAAMANIDTCEKNPQAAERINGELPGQFAQAARKRHIKLVHISTDAVFNGIDSGNDGYRETDTPTPINTYARSKLLGEQHVLECDPNALVARVNFYGWSISGKRSLAEIFYCNLAAGKTMMGFTDVFVSSLCIYNLADILNQMIDLNASGLYHVFSRESQSKYFLGLSIARKFGLDDSLITPVSWRDAGLSAVRSPDLRMNVDKLSSILNEAPPNQATCLESFYQSFRQGLPQQLAAYANPHQESHHANKNRE